MILRYAWNAVSVTPKERVDPCSPNEAAQIQKQADLCQNWCMQFEFAPGIILSTGKSCTKNEVGHTSDDLQNLSHAPVCSGLALLGIHLMVEVGDDKLNIL